MTGAFSGIAPRFNAKLNNCLGDSVVGGQITAAPSGGLANAGESTYPGLRIILGAADALANSDTTVGTLYAGLYLYVRTPSTSTNTPTIGHLAFVDTSSANEFQVTPDETGNTGASLPAGIFVSTLTKGNSWWILVSGKIQAQFKASLTGTGANGCGVYVSADTYGTLDVLTGATFLAAVSANNASVPYATLDNMIKRFMGVAEVAPTSNSASLVDIALRNMWRW